MLEAVLLTLLYLLFFLAIGALATGAGHLIASSVEGRRASDLLWGLLLRYGLGLSLMSGLMIWLGLLGGISRWAVLPTVLIPSAAGLWRLTESREADLSPLKRSLAELWAGSAPLERAAFGAIAVWTSLLSLNILIGGMAPDMSHDPMWYHLSVPGQWAITGRALAFPYVFPSNYPLALEAIYAGLLVYGNEILCSVVAAQIALVLLAGMVVVAARWLGRRGALWTAACVVGAVANGNCVAPISVKSDRFASLLLLLIFGALMDSLRERNRDGDQTHGGAPRGTFAVGLLIGSVTAAKTLTIGYWLPMTAICLGANALAGGGFWRAARMGALLAAGACAAYLPWAIRGLSYSGDPLFPFGSRLFPIHAPFDMAYEGVRAANSLYPSNWTGVAAALGPGLRAKIARALASSDIMLGLYAAGAATALLAPSRQWRIQGLVLASFLPVFLMIRGANEVVRYFAICYPLAAPAVALLLDGIACRLSRRGQTVFLLALFMATALTYLKGQLLYASFHTIQWKFHPIVTQTQRLAFASHAEKGEYYLYFREIQPLIEKDARVFMPDCHYPFYLERQCVWADEVVGPLLRRNESEDARMTGQESARETWRSLREQRFDYVLLTEGEGRFIYDEMASAGLATAIPLPHPVPSQWSLIRIAPSPKNGALGTESAKAPG